MSTPYTHAAHMARCCQAVREGKMLERQHVQVMRRGVLYCAQICAAWTTPDGIDCWTVETTYPEAARFTVPVKQVRLCGDASCICVEEAPATPAATASEARRKGGGGASEGLKCL